mgnify:CR=1 FL=1
MMALESLDNVNKILEQFTLNILHLIYLQIIKSNTRIFSRGARWQPDSTTLQQRIQSWSTADHSILKYFNPGTRTRAAFSILLNKEIDSTTDVDVESCYRVHWILVFLF